MVECYIAKEAMEFCIEYLLGIDAIGIPSDRRNEWKLGKPMPGGQIVTIDLIYYCKHITTYWRIQQSSNLTLSKCYQFSHYGWFTYFILVTLTKFCLFNFIVSMWST